MSRKFADISERKKGELKVCSPKRISENKNNSAIRTSEEKLLLINEKNEANLSLDLDPGQAMNWHGWLIRVRCFT